MRASRFVLAALLGGTLLGGATAASANVLIEVDKSTQHMTVSVDGQQRWDWPVSTGRSGYSTPSGNFTPFRMEEDHYSKEWDDAPMPHSIFFTKEGHAIHGTLESRHLGVAASHGCVRLAPANAAKLFALVKEEGLGKTKVVLTGTEAAAVARRGTPRAPVDEAAYAPRPPLPRYETDGYGGGYRAPMQIQPGYYQQDSGYYRPAYPRDNGYGGYNSRY